MIVSIMQPYFFPYIGYFQLIHASDVFVACDNVQYVKKRWMNRNRIIGRPDPQWLTFPVAHAGMHRSINERCYVQDKGSRARLLQKICTHYRRAPFFPAVMPAIEEIVLYPDSNVASFNINLIRKLCGELGIGTRIEISSSLGYRQLQGSDYGISVCKQLGATHYLNSAGGRALHLESSFAKHGLELRFLESNVEPYTQFAPPHLASLSIIDVLMFNDPQKIQRMLRQYRLVRA